MEKNIYSGTKISVRVLSAAIFVGLGILGFLIAFLSANGGFEISFDTGGGSDVAPQHLRYGDSIVEPMPPVKEGAEFAGWYTDPSFSEKFDFESAQVESSITVYAAWNEND